VSQSSGRTPALAVGAALGVVYVVWGSTYLGMAIAIEGLPPLLMSALRFLIAGALLFAVATRLDRREDDRPGRRQWLAALVTSVPLLAIGNAGVAWAEQSVATGIAALIIASVPLWIALLDRVFFGRRLTLQAVVGLAIGFGGIALLVGPGGGGGLDPVGTTVLVVAALGWSTGTLLSRGAALPSRPLVASSMQMLAGGTVLFVVSAAAGELDDVGAAAAAPKTLLAMAYLILFGSILAFSCYGWLIRTTRTSLVATYAYVNPVVAVLLGRIVLGEQLGARTIVAGGIVVAAVALIVSAQPRSRPETQREPGRSSPRGVRRSAARLRAAMGTRGR
jgi:drug/metabolite transporter (DMT)-like permease